MKIGTGKFRINPVVYIKKSLQVLTKPKWFYNEFFPKIPVEVTYTMLALIAGVGVVLNYLNAVLTGGGILSIIPIILFAVFMIAIGAGITFVVFYIGSIFFDAIDKSPKALWKLACFTMTLNGLAMVLTVGGWYGMVLSILLWVVMSWFFFQTLIHYFRAPTWFVYLQLAMAALMLVSMAVTLVALLPVLGGIEASIDSSLESIKELERLQRKLGH